jgi:hypothetical protein
MLPVTVFTTENQYSGHVYLFSDQFLPVKAVKFCSLYDFLVVRYDSVFAINS